MRSKLLTSLIILALATGLLPSASGARVPAPVLTTFGNTLHWNATSKNGRYVEARKEGSVTIELKVVGTEDTPPVVEGATVEYRVHAAGAPNNWSNPVTITYTSSNKEQEERELKEKEQKELEEREAKEKAEREAKEKAEREKAEKEQAEKEQREKELKEKEEREQKEREEKEVKGEAGKVKTRLDAKSEFDGYPVSWFAKLTRLLAYPTAGDRYTKTVPTLAYHDAWTTWGSSGATHKSEYVAWTNRDKGAGYLGQFMDDINFQGGNVAGTRAQYRELIEAIRAALGPAGVIEINAQYANIWPLIKSKDPDVLKALEYVNIVTKEFNVDPISGIDTPGEYREFFEYTDFLEAKKVGITLTGDSSHNTEADREYSLATYFLANLNGFDFIGFSKQSPSSEYAGLLLNLGNATSGRSRASTGVWKREFVGGIAYTLEPGASTQTITLPKAMKNLKGETVTTVTLTSAHGAVLRY